MRVCRANSDAAQRKQRNKVDDGEVSLSSFPNTVKLLFFSNLKQCNVRENQSVERI